MTETEYLQHFRDTCKQLADSGFARTAWRALRVELDRLAPKIDVVPRLETVITLAQIMLLDEEYDFAYQLLRGHVYDVSATTGHPVSHDFTQVLFRAAIENYYLREANEAYKLASQVAVPDLDSLGAQLEWSAFLNEGPSIGTGIIP
jgi:hypothetical protein